MRTALKILAGAGLLFVLLLIGIVVAVKSIDVNAFIGPIKDRVKAATGRELTVRGSADLKLSLQPRLVLTDVALSNAPWGKAPQMLSAKQLELEVALMPLISRRFELVEIDLVGPVIALETNAKGEGNWEFGQAASGGPAAASSTPGAAMAFGVGNVAITDGTLTYRDGATGGVTTVSINRFFVRARDPQSPIAAQLQGKVNDVPMALEGTLGPLASLLAKRWPYPVSLKGQVNGQPTQLTTKVRAQDQTYALDDLQLAYGALALTGEFSVVTGGARPRLLFNLAAPSLATASLPLPVAAGAKAPAGAAKTPSRFVFPETPVDFAPLRLVDARGSLHVGRLMLAGGRPLDNLRLQLALNGGRLEISPFSAAIYGGTVTGSVTIDASRAGTSTVALAVAGKGLDLGALLAAAGHPRDVRGGKSELNVNLTMRGGSPHAWASSASGIVRLVVGPASLVNPKSGPESAFERLAQAVNPLRTSEPSTELTCAVVRLPLQDGIARVDRSIAMETRQLGVSASGTLDFRNETLDFAFAPKVRKGIPIDIPNLAQLVRFSGPFASPQVRVDAAASAAAIASIGAAVGTSGLSMIGQSLLSAAAGAGEGGACQIALGNAPGGPAAGQPGKPSAPVPIADDLGKAIGRLFGR